MRHLPRWSPPETFGTTFLVEDLKNKQFQDPSKLQKSGFSKWIEHVINPLSAIVALI